MSELKPIEILDRNPFKHMVATIGNLPTSFVDSMSYYECIAWLAQYIKKTLIPAVNADSEAIEELQAKYIELKDYVDHYFDNLDVQDEINNKLDEMAEAGTLEEIIAQYLNANAVWCFDNVADMKNATNLIDGSFAKTLGYYEKNDGGEATYKIRNAVVGDDVDESFLITISETLVAELIIPDKLSIKALGARPMAKDGTKYDIKPYIDKYIAKIDDLSMKFKLFIPSGVWYSSPCDLTSIRGFDIEGVYCYNNYGVNGTVITTLTDNQQYLFNVGTNINNVYTTEWSLKNMLLSTFDYSYRTDRNNQFFVSTPKTVSKCVLNLLYATQGITDNLMFINVQGEALQIASCWENKFNYLVFRYVSNPTGEIVSFRSDKTYGASANISANYFPYMAFESTHGDLIGVYQKADIGNNHFGTINFETGLFDYSSNNITYTSSTTLPAQVNHLAIFNVHDGGTITSNTIDDINLNNFPNRYYTYNSQNYMYDTIIKTGSGYMYIGLDILNITNTGGNQPIVVLKNDNTNVYINTNYLHILNMTTTSSFKFDIDKNFSDLSYNGNCSSFNSDRVKLAGIQKFYKNATQNDGAIRLTSLDDGLFDDKISVEFPRFVSTYQVKTYASGTKLYVLAKIPNGETSVFRYRANGGTGYNTSLVGTGSFKWYEVDMSENVNIGDKIEFKIDGNSATIAYYDSFIF